MREITLGRTGITVPQNAFGALPIQRVPMAEAVPILRSAYDGGMRYFDTARAYTDSEEKLGEAFAGMRDKIYIATTVCGIRSISRPRPRLRHRRSSGKISTLR